ncbi:hypothetical protein H2200_008549 [Cladophialophora chaetospira]|uniref:4a-hydroxytetrahydrobiopterin dehydratase n=1 Tax=Cladophialophora chaetospira TaxID=386627 RepID=A0AA38X4E8_9EURO|nr:hypothetical protein H2200_008549 [Cladophialophora chaetospira]
MLQARHVGSRSFIRNVTASIDRNVNITSKPSLWRSPLPPTTCRTSGSSRSLHLAHTAAITFPPSCDTISIHLKDGERLVQKFSPTPRANLDKLREALTELLQSPEPAPSPIESPDRCGKKKGIPGPSFGAGEWLLDPEGDAIHRHTAHAWAGELDIIEKLIIQRADQIHHHPHITRGRVEDGEYTLMTITCTTHSPRGLSNRDMRLARIIKRILSDFNTTTAPILDDWQTWEEDQLKITAQRERMIAINREKINKALENCGCEPQFPPISPKLRGLPQRKGQLIHFVDSKRQGGPSLAIRRVKGTAVSNSPGHTALVSNQS